MEYTVKTLRSLATHISNAAVAGEVVACADAVDELLQLMESTSNMLRGMLMDPAIPSHAKDALMARIAELDASVEKNLE